jgi:hypothetical protein
MLGLCTTLTAPALAQNPPHARVTDRERDAFGAAIGRSDVEALRAIVGRAVTQSSGLAFERSNPETLIETTRGCRLFEAARIGDDPDMWFRYTCPGWARGTIEPWEEPGVYVRLWHHPGGFLATSYYFAPVQVRPSPHRGYPSPPPPPPPPAPPRRPNP